MYVGGKVSLYNESPTITYKQPAVR